MRKLLMSFLCLSAAAVVTAGVPFVRASRTSAVYSSGEEIVFKVTGDCRGMTYTVNDGVKVTRPQPLKSEIRLRADDPGFILISISGPKDAKGRVASTFAGAAVEPGEILPGTTRPADFDAFWNGELRRLRSYPLVVKEIPVDAKFLPKGVKAFNVTITRGDVTATGFVALPANAKPKTLPGCLTFLGASLVSADLNWPARLAAQQKALAFSLNFQGLPNEWPRNAQKDQAARKRIGLYYRKLADNRQNYAMRKIFLRTVLAADYLMRRPEYNGKKLATIGGSLGGCQSLVCAALVPQVTFCVSQAPAMCDHFGPKSGHLPGWPNLLHAVPKAAANAPYYDVVNFARRVKCPVYMSVGFVDTVCPPASSYAAYNTLTVPRKVMAHTVTGGHGGRIDPRDPDVFGLWHKRLAVYLTKK